MLLIIYCVACYCFLYGLNEDLHSEGQHIKLISFIFAPLNVPRILGQMVMTQQKVNRRMLGKLKARERKEKQREADRITRIMQNEFSQMGKAMKRAVDELNKKPANMATKGKSIYDVGSRRPMNY